MHKLIEGLEGVEVVADDFLIHGSDKQTHKANLHAFLQRCKERNVVLNFEKIRIGCKKVPFIEHVATPDKVRAALDMPQLTDVAGVKPFLGMVQYLAKFLPKLSEMTQPLCVLMNKDSEFCWNSSQSKAFKQHPCCTITDWQMK